jgi:hypothetical protein
MLNIYTDKSKIPSNLEYIHDNDGFFPENRLQGTDMDKHIVETIDIGKYVDGGKFIDRLGNATSIGFLSMSSKTLLNIVNNTDKVFNGVEMGADAIILLIESMCDGNLYLPYPIYFDIPDYLDVSAITLNGNTISKVDDLYVE